jgi:hypothetical protein
MIYGQRGLGRRSNFVKVRTHDALLSWDGDVTLGVCLLGL